MSYPDALSQWRQTVSTQLPHLNRPQALVLALWSYAMIFARSCGTTLGAAWLAQLVGGSEDCWRQRLRQWCYDAADKKGEHRTQKVTAAYYSHSYRGKFDVYSFSAYTFTLLLQSIPLDFYTS